MSTLKVHHNTWFDHWRALECQLDRCVDTNDHHHVHARQAAQEARWSLFERFAKVTKFARENIAEYSMGGKAQDAHPAPLQHLHDEAVG